MQRIIVGGALAGAAWIINKLGTVLAPARELDVFPHRLHAKGRRWWHADAYAAAPGWVFIEAAGWTVEVAWKAPA